MPSTKEKGTCRTAHRRTCIAVWDIICKKGNSLNTPGVAVTYERKKKKSNRLEGLSHSSYDIG